MMRRFPVFLLVAILMIGLVPAAAGAQTDEEAAAIAALEGALDGIGCITVEGCIEEVAELKAAVAALKVLFADLDYAACDAGIADLDAAIEGGDLDVINGAADTAVAACTAVAVAAAEAAAGGTTTTIAEVVTDIPDGGSGPNVGLLGVVALLVLLASGVFVLRLNSDRR